MVTAELASDSLVSRTSLETTVPLLGREPRMWRTGGNGVDPPRPGERLAVYALLAVILGIQAWLLAIYWTPVHGGTDQNGYLVTARLLAEKGSLHFVPADPFQFVGSMMIRTEDGRVFAKYPFGFPLLAALGRVLGGTAAMYGVNPLCTLLACLAAFFLFRLLLNHFAALLGVLWLAWNPLVLTYANDANSHASTLLCVTVGMWGLLSWQQGRSTWRGMIGALALGYAATIRYTEVLLVLPVLFVVLSQVRKDWKSLRRPAMVLLAWVLPVGALALVCWVCYGAPWRTGYAYCSEDTGFAWKYLWGDGTVNRQGHWETLLVQMNWMGLFILWPLGVTGIVGLLGQRWRLAVALGLWVAPPVGLYLFYYWAPEGETSTGYLRFFISVLPGLILAALWLLQRALSTDTWSRAVALGLLTALGLAVNLGNIMPSLETNFYRKAALSEAAQFVQQQVPPGSVLFVGDEELSNHLDGVGGYTLYNLQLFSNSAFGSLDRVIEDKDRQFAPDPRQRARTQLYLDLLGKTGVGGYRVPRTNEELRQVQYTIMEQYLRQGQHVMVLLHTGQNRDLLPQRSGWQVSLRASQQVYPAPVLPSRPIGGWKLQGRAGLGEASLGKPVTWSLYEILPVPAGK